MTKSEGCDCGTPFILHTRDHPECSVSNAQGKTNSTSVNEITEKSESSKKSDTNAFSDTPTLPVVPAPKKKHVFLTTFFGLLFVFWLVGQFSGSDTSSTSSVTPSSNSYTPAAVYDDSWIPSGFNGYPDSDNLAWRWGTKKETDCSYSSGSCWSVMVVARDGCPSSLYAELKIFDSTDIQIDYTNDTTSSVSPMQKVKLTFDTFNEDASSARIGELTCY